ncbi:Serpentine receptor class epsilon-38 [Caenorhabditis elegans]|uniref:Serpentine receptor class epsilon-38 n=1 Tax=Caenorhabditis elegans TaxID=6239 RepID=SRE38_CAEEL|nr:Serpentine receptor class epsilon-38 [Caenorhabditis elegans]O17816.2 RecName: Full=Serpentine receptor class epsilon-38; Short=Protein sre-38 [Caenorhabditis elegans]CAB02945.2 Serpentine receptor class epsilon-38 [Caenorhabditis elegans]|eukprot:NP_496651.1 Serpentine receptor class epsilon-38 [Caenorhabditis elegans]
MIKFNSTNKTYWLPIYIMNDTSFQSGMYLYLLLTEILLYVGTGVIICKTVRTFLKIRLFHRNMNIMTALFLCQWFEAIAAKLLIIPYQIGVIRFSDYNKPYVSWWTDNEQEIIVLPEPTANSNALVISGFLIWHYAYTMIFGILNLGIERIFATVMLKDYENKPRLYIPVFLITSTHLITLTFSYFVLTNRTGFYLGTSPCFLNSALVVMTFLAVWKVNKHRHEKLEGSGPGCDYTLSQQFQVRENYRALKLAKNLVIVVLCAISVPCALLICLVIGAIPSFRMIFIHIMENFIYLNPVIICSTLMFSAPAWRAEYLKLIPGYKKIKSTRVFVVRPKPQTTHRASSTVVHDEGQMYFEQLNNSWK